MGIVPARERFNASYFYDRTKKSIKEDYEIKIVNRNSKIGRIVELEIANEKAFY